MNFLVTGCAGFIGSHFTKLLISKGHTVIGVDKLSYAGNVITIDSALEDYDGINCSKFSLFEADISDNEKMYQLLVDNGITHVVNFAAESHVDRSIDSPVEFMQNNAVGTAHLMNAFLRHWIVNERPGNYLFVQVSTDEVYGSCEDGKFTESSPYDPSSPYSASKAAADHCVRAFNRTFGLPVIITNCSNNYGPYQLPEKLIPLMILRSKEFKELPIYGDGEQVRDWIHVIDHCSAIDFIIEHGESGTYLVGASNEVSNIKLVKSICDIMDSLPINSHNAPFDSHHDLIKFVTDRPGHDKRYAIDWSKLNNLGWSPKISFEDGLSSTVHWYLQNSWWVDKVSGDIHNRRQGLA